MSGQTEGAIDAPPGATGQSGRQRSRIGFPYMDLNAAVQIAEAIHNHVAYGSCEDDQLAAWTDQSGKSSTFRVQVYTARMFGVIEQDGEGHKLTTLGRSVVDPNQSRQAKATAFLNVPLYEAVYERYKGGVLPPAAALEREMVSLGVSDKQKDRARQAFERSADQAGFFEHGRNRLVKPGSPQRDENTGTGGGGESEKHKVQDDSKKRGDGSGGTGNGSSLDPLIQALIDKIPAADASKPWPVDGRVMWLQMLSMALQMTHGQVEQINIDKG